MIGQWIVIVLLALLLAGCGVADDRPFVAQPQPTATPVPTGTPDPGSTSYPPRSTSTSQPVATLEPPTIELPSIASGVAANADQIDQMLSALNLRRSEARCPPVAIDERLQQAAQAHAAAIAARREVSHTSADGSTLDQRLERAGYTYQRRSETIAVAQDASALEIVDCWLDEPIDGPHRSSVLNCVYSAVGIGVAHTEAGMRYWVVDYAQPIAD